jgi:hypothetical protein
MEKSATITKSELATQCGVSLGKIRQWCNVDFFAELSKLGYHKDQKIFTPCQTQFIKENILEYREK